MLFRSPQETCLAPRWPRRRDRRLERDRRQPPKRKIPRRAWIANFRVRNTTFHALCTSPFTPNEDVPCPSETLIQIPNRDPRLPRLYLLKKHAKVKQAWKAKRIFVYLQDTSPAAMEEFYKFVSSMQFPEGTDKGIAKAGTSSPNVKSAVSQLTIHRDCCGA